MEELSISKTVSVVAARDPAAADKLTAALDRLYRISALVAAAIRGPAAFQKTYEDVDPPTDELAEVLQLVSLERHFPNREQNSADRAVGS